MPVFGISAKREIGHTMGFQIKGVDKDDIRLYIFGKGKYGNPEMISLFDIDDLKDTLDNF